MNRLDLVLTNGGRDRGREGGRRQGEMREGAGVTLEGRERRRRK